MKGYILLLILVAVIASGLLYLSRDVIAGIETRTGTRVMQTP